MTEKETLTIGKDSATVKAISVCWNFLNQIDPQVFDEWEDEQEFVEALEAVRLAINELDKASLIAWEPEQ